MRLSEKTLELSICSQFGARLDRQVIWFGLTQKQEARAGFDACTRHGARFIVFQFKASKELRNSGVTRRFKAPHAQMEALRKRARRGREIFYVLPNLGTTEELGQNSDLLSQSWGLDVQTLPLLSPAMNENGTPRKSGEHFLDLAPPFVTIRSDPVKVAAVSLQELVPQVLHELSDWPAETAGAFFERWDREPWPFGRKSVAAAIIPG